jgi:Zn-dependent peptidase ImmA (M78 family)
MHLSRLRKETFKRQIIARLQCSFKDALLISSRVANIQLIFQIAINLSGCRCCLYTHVYQSTNSWSTRWLNDTPLIQLSGRYKRNDSFWFTFFHEAGHIILHGKKDIFLEKIDYSDFDRNKEEEADNFAIKWTLTKEEEQEIIDSAPLTEADIKSFAKKFNTHPAIIIERLQHDELIPYGLGRQFFRPVEFN